MNAYIEELKNKRLSLSRAAYNAASPCISKIWLDKYAAISEKIKRLDCDC